MSAPTIACSAFIQGTLDPNFWYVGQKPFGCDFYLDVTNGGENILMVEGETFMDRGVKCTEYRPSPDIDYTGWRAKVYVRFYHPQPW